MLAATKRHFSKVHDTQSDTLNYNGKARKY